MPTWTIVPRSYSFDPVTSKLSLTLSDPDLAATKYHAFTVLLDADGEPLWVDVKTSVFTNNGGLATIGTMSWEGSTNHLEVVVKTYDQD